MSLDRRLKQLEGRAGSKPWTPSERTVQALEEYFAVLRGEEVLERADPELDAYLAEVDEYRRRLERRNK